MSNVRDFGAAGDGQTDDTEALQHAVSDGEGLLTFDPGEYRITKTIEVPLDRRGPFGMQGAAGTATIVMAGSGPAFRLIGTHEGTGDPASVKPGVWTEERMPTVANLAVRGDHPEADGFELVQTMQAVFHGVLVHKCRDGIRIVKRNRNVLISNCHIYFNTGVGIYLDQLNLHQINIVGNHISYNRLGGIRIRRSEIRNLQITGNDIEYNNHRAHEAEPFRTAEIFIDTADEGASIEEVTIASNTIQATASPEGANIRIIEEPETGRPPGLWTITGNIIGSQQNNVHLTACHGIVLSGNFIYSAEQHNVLLENCTEINLTGNSFRRHTGDMGTGVRLVDSRDCVLNGCTIRDESEAGQASGLSLLEIERCQRINVSGCQMINGVPYGIDVRESSMVNFNGCTIVDTRRVPKGKAAVKLMGSDDCVLSGCSLGEKATDEHAFGQLLLELERCQRVTASSCHLIGGQPYGVDVRESSMVNINGCTIADTHTVPRATAAVRFTGSGQGNLVSGNILTEILGKSVEADDASKVTQANNVTLDVLSKRP